MARPELIYTPPMVPRLYVETSVLSYLTARPSTSIITAAHQYITTTWWSSCRNAFDVFTSELVVEEAARGDLEAASRRLAALDGIPILGSTVIATELALSIV